MTFIEKIRDIWERYGGGFDSLAPCEQVEILHGAWTFSLALSVFASIASLVVMLVRLIEFLA